MEHHDAAVLAQVNIQFAGVGALFVAEPEGGDGVFGRVK
jgi:hypothetical protein